MRSVGLLGEPLVINQGLGQWLSLQRAVRPSSSEARGGLEVPAGATAPPGFSRSRVCKTLRGTRSRAGVNCGFRRQIMHVSSFGRCRVNHRLVEQAPGDGISAQDRSRVPTGSRSMRIEVASDAEQWPRRTCRPRLLDGDGPVSQSRHHGCHGTSVPTKNQMKHRKAGNH